MQLGLTDDQVLLHDTTFRFIETELPVDKTRLLHDDPLGFDRAWLQKAAALGWFAMLAPEAHGGGNVSGDGIADAAIIAEALGRHVQPGPFVPMNVVAAVVAAHASDALRSALLPRVVTAETAATWAFASLEGTFDHGAGVAVDVGVDGSTLRGTRGFVQDVANCDVVLVTATRGDEPVQVVVPTDAPGVRIEPLVSLDLSRRFAHLHFDDVRVDADAIIEDGTAAIDHALRIAVALHVAETVGAIDQLFSMTVAYAKDRIAFGRPIGSFQAVKHLLADQLLYLESSKACSDAAVRAVSNEDPAADEVVSMAAAYVGDVTTDIAQECLQVHGGIGYTWEHDLHLYLRRVRSNAALYGTSTWHRERVCAWHRLGDHS